MKHSLLLGVMGILASSALVSCTPGEKGALVGGAIGAGTGALVGDGTGALIGGAIGAVAGSEISKNRAARNDYYNRQYGPPPGYYDGPPPGYRKPPRGGYGYGY